jgi:hypothetical protein
MVIARRSNNVKFKHVLILSGVPAKSTTGSAMTTFWRTLGQSSRVRIVTGDFAAVAKLPPVRLTPSRQ